MSEEAAVSSGAAAAVGAARPGTEDA